MVHAYEEQARTSASQHRLLFHAYSFGRYTGMLNALFVAIAQPDPFAEDIQTNDTFKCALLAARGLSKSLGKDLERIAGQAFQELWYTTEELVEFIRHCRSDMLMTNIPQLLHAAAVILFTHLRNTMLNDVCIYREIIPEATLCELLVTFSPAVDLRGNDTELTLRNLRTVLQTLIDGVNIEME